MKKRFNYEPDKNVHAGPFWHKKKKAPIALQ